MLYDFAEKLEAKVIYCIRKGQIVQASAYFNTLTRAPMVGGRILSPCWILLIAQKQRQMPTRNFQHPFQHQFDAFLQDFRKIRPEMYGEMAFIDVMFPHLGQKERQMFEAF